MAPTSLRQLPSQSFISISVIESKKIHPLRHLLRCEYHYHGWSARSEWSRDCCRSPTMSTHTCTHVHTQAPKHTFGGKDPPHDTFCCRNALVNQSLLSYSKHKRAHTCTPTRAQAHTCAHIYTHTRTYLHAYARRHTYAHIRTRTRTQAHTCAHTYAEGA